MKQRGRLPSHLQPIYGSFRSYQQEKRRELSVALGALETLRCGCAWMPDQGKIIQAINLLKECRDLMSRRKWGK